MLSIELILSVALLFSFLLCLGLILAVLRLSSRPVVVSVDSPPVPNVEVSVAPSSLVVDLPVPVVNFSPVVDLHPTFDVPEFDFSPLLTAFTNYSSVGKGAGLAAPEVSSGPSVNTPSPEFIPLPTPSSLPVMRSVFDSTDLTSLSVRHDRVLFPDSFSYSSGAIFVADVDFMPGDSTRPFGVFVREASFGAAVFDTYCSPSTSSMPDDRSFINDALSCVFRKQCVMIFWDPTNDVSTLKFPPCVNVLDISDEGVWRRPMVKRTGRHLSLGQQSQWVGFGWSGGHRGIEFETDMTYRILHKLAAWQGFSSAAEFVNAWRSL